jgi:hypothetical protein
VIRVTTTFPAHLHRHTLKIVRHAPPSPAHRQNHGVRRTSRTTVYRDTDRRACSLCAVTFGTHLTSETLRLPGLQTDLTTLLKIVCDTRAAGAVPSPLQVESCDTVGAAIRRATDVTSVHTRTGPCTSPRARAYVQHTTRHSQPTRRRGVESRILIKLHATS